MRVARPSIILFSAILLSCAPPGDESKVSEPTPQLFDTAHVEAALAYFAAPDEAHLLQIAETPAARHLLKHSAVTGYYDADATALDISRDLVAKAPSPEKLAAVRELLGRINRTPEGQQGCQADAAKHLPEDFRHAAPLYVTWGYDIGVSMNGSASVNLAHSRFAANPDELWFCCTHEMHHAGLTAYHPFPMVIADISATADMLAFIRYSTMLEGMAVHAAYAPRQAAGALADDPDYVALGDAARMAAYERAYWEIYLYFERAGDRPLTEADWEKIGPLSDGDRLWYRVGALMAAEIEADIGAASYRELPRLGPDAFFGHYWQEAELQQ